MKSETNLAKALAMALLACYGAVETKAAFVDYTIDNNTSEMIGGFSASLDGSSVGSGFYAGGIQITEAPGGPSGMPAQYTTFCTDIGGDIYLGSTYGFSAPTLFAGQTGVAPLNGWGATPSFASAAIQNAAYLFYNYGIYGGVLASGNADQMAGLQMAIWEALYDTGNPLGLVEGAKYNSASRLVLSGGNASDYTIANADLAGLTGLYDLQGYLLVPEPVDPSGQNGAGQELLIAQGAFTPAGVVPEPGAYAAAASGVAVLSLFGLRRKPRHS